MTPALLARLRALYPVLDTLHGLDLEAVFARHTVHVEAPSGHVLFTEGAPCRGFPLVLKGEVRVAKVSAAGRSLELYRVTPGEMCVLSTTCLFGQVAHSADAACVEATELVLLSADGFEELTAEPAFRRYAFGVLAERIAQLMTLVEAVAFQRLDQRLAAALLGSGAVLQATHQELADEVGTVREIVTRLLKRFEAEGLVSMGRRRIELRDPAALRDIAQGRFGDHRH
jgi:CRP/FNR family transcriptional regulator